MTVYSFTWDRGRAEVQALAAMLGPIEFDLGQGRSVQPMAVAPWADDTGPEFDALPGLMKKLRGEWPCVPFGAPITPDGLPSQWAGVSNPGTGDDFHGFGSHNVWNKTEDLPGGIELGIDYPDDHAICGLTRRIQGVPGQTSVEITLTIKARSDISLPIALHPVFKLPSTHRAARLDVGPFEEARSFPIAVEPQGSCFEQNAVISDLSKVRHAAGEVDVTRLPMDMDTEELIQVSGAKGEVSLENAPEGYRATLTYDADVFPSVLLWFSNRGRSAYPWNGRHVALGIEPVRGAFDLGPEVGANPNNPIAKSGFATSLSLTAGQVFSTTYAISVASL